MCESVYDVGVYCIYAYISIFRSISVSISHTHIYQILNAAWDE